MRRAAWRRDASRRMGPLLVVLAVVAVRAVSDWVLPYALS